MVYEEVLGVLLAGGRGTRLDPLTRVVSKHFLPVFDKPLIFYSLSILLIAGVRKIIMVVNPSDEEGYRLLLGDGSELGLSIQFVYQEKSLGVPSAIACASAEIVASGANRLCVVLGDNLVFGHGLAGVMEELINPSTACAVGSYEVMDPERYGVFDYDAKGKILGIVEKPRQPPSNVVATGVYSFDMTLIDILSSLEVSARGETEIVDVLNRYLALDELEEIRFGRGLCWLDAGTPAALLEASNFVALVEERQGLKIGFLPEICWRNGWIDSKHMDHFVKSDSYLARLVDRKHL